MGTPWSIPLFFILFISLNPISPSHGNSDLIERTCKNTNYYNLCISSLISYSSSLDVDTKGLALIMVRVGIANVTATNAYLSSQMLSITNDTLMKKVIKECAQKYAFASDALQNMIQDLSATLYDYAYLHVMASQDYANGCHNAFKRYPGLIYPVEIGVREDGLKHICDVVLGIIDAIG